MSLESKYDSSSIDLYSGLEAVRKNPWMYIGSVESEGVHHLLYELVYNSIDEAMAGLCSRIEVAFHADGSCSVLDDGRGIPVENHPVEMIPACELVLTKLHSGGKFRREGAYSISSGIHGVGLSCVNALSSSLLFETVRNGERYQQKYSKGAPQSSLEQIGPSREVGTTICFKPDSEIFQDISFDFEVVRKRLNELAHLHSNLAIVLKDERSGKKIEMKYDGGVSGFLSQVNANKMTIPMKPIEMQYIGDKVEFEIALQWSTQYEDRILSFVNSVNTIHGGTHVQAVLNGTLKAVNDYISSNGLMEQDDEEISMFDLFEGITGVLSFKILEPTFEGQTKTILTNRDFVSEVELAVFEKFSLYFANNPSESTSIFQKIIESKRAKTVSRKVSEKVYLNQHHSDFFVDDVYKKQFGIRSKNWHKSAVWIADEELLQKHVEHLDVPENAKMLDVCCGSGVVGGSFRGKVGSLTGLDITPEMVELAKERLDEVHQGNVYEIPFEDNSFDLVVTREVLHLLPYPEKPVSEIFRVLKPGGQFIVGQILPYSEIDAPWMYRVFKKKQPLIYNMFQEEDFRSMLTGAGFTSMRMTEHLLWESIDVWIDTHETTPLHRYEIRDLFHNASESVRKVHPFKIMPDGEIMDQWRWCIFSVKKPV